MKKLISLLFSIFIFTNVQVSASNIEVQPVFNMRTMAQDRVWVGTFHLVWNDFINKVVFSPIRFREGTPNYVRELNKQGFTENDITEKCFYKYTGRVTKKTKKLITKAIRKKFKESSDLLDKLELTPRNDMLLIYAMLKKDFEFLNEFDKLGHSIFGGDDVAEYFGIDAKSDNKLGQGVSVLFYNNSQDFAVKLATKSEDEVYLYKNSVNKPFNLLWADMFKKQAMYNGKKDFAKTDELKIPNIKFFEEKVFEELTNKRIMGTNMVINQAMETIKFDMNNKGVKLKTEAALTLMTTSLAPQDDPRYFYFDNTFVLFLKEKEKSKPYFALRVHDIKNYQEQRD